MLQQTLTSPATQQPTNRVGSFLLGARLPELSERTPNALFASASGAPDSQCAGAGGVAMCLSLPEGNTQLVDQAMALLARIAAFSEPRAVPILEAGVAGRIAYVIDAQMPGERLSARLARDRKLAPWQAAVIVHDVAGALAAAHQQRLSHGAVSATLVWIDGQGRARLGGFGLLGRGPARDQWLLAALAFELLAGFPWNPQCGDGTSGEVLVERVRGRTNGLTQPVGRALARGLESDAARQFPDVADFAAAFGEAVKVSSGELAAGAWEAISRDDLTMAAILVEMTATYNPAEPELALLRVRLNEGAMRDAAYATAALASPAAAIPMTAPDVAAAVAGQRTAPAQWSEETAGRFLTPPGMPGHRANTAPAAPPKPGRSPWLVFAIGACACVIVLTILVAVTFSTV